MENKKAIQVILEHIATDPELKEKVLTSDAKEFMEQLKEKGFLDIAEEKAQKILDKVKAAFSAKDEELDADTLEKVCGGAFFGNCVSCETLC